MKTEVQRGPNIKPLPEMASLPDTLEVEVVIKVGDNISTDTIMPAGTKVLPLRSNIEAISEFVFYQLDPDFHVLCKEKRRVAVVGGENYGQGSSREHAALCPRWLGVRAVVVAQFARIHVANLVNFGIVPLTFKNLDDYAKVNQGDTVSIDVSDLERDLYLTLGSERLALAPAFEPKDVPILKAGGALPYFKATYRD